MRDVTDRFLDEISRAHRMAVLVEVLSAGAPIAEISSVVDGTVTLDITAATRGRADLSIADDGTGGWIPTSSGSLLAPYGNELRISRGVNYADGSTELVKLGVFRIDRAQPTEDSSGLTVQVSGTDRSARIIDARFEAPYTVAAGTNVDTAIRDVLLEADPSLQFDLTTTTATTGLVVAQEGDDRWKFAQDLATSLGHVLYFDGDGIVTSRPLSIVGATAPAAQLREGDGGLLVSAAREWARANVYNRVIATGESTDAAIPTARGIATDDDPASPTYYAGPFGHVPRFYTSPFITTNDQAADAAAGLLAKVLGTSQSVSFGTVVNPALEPNDVAHITRERLGLDQDHVIDTITVPLSPAGVMTGRTRSITTTE